jgi:hypothetical protein
MTAIFMAPHYLQPAPPRATDFVARIAAAAAA